MSPWEQTRRYMELFDSQACCDQSKLVRCAKVMASKNGWPGSMKTSSKTPQSYTVLDFQMKISAFRGRQDTLLVSSRHPSRGVRHHVHSTCLRHDSGILCAAPKQSQPLGPRKRENCTLQTLNPLPACALMSTIKDSTSILYLHRVSSGHVSC